MKRGRPVYSQIRQNIIDILSIKGSSYGYEIYKIHREIFPKVTMRVIYYHLKKGLALEELKINKIKKEKGDYSWGGEAEKIYYELGPNAKPKPNKNIKKYLDKNGK